MPRRLKCPLKPEAEEGIKQTIKGLINTGVLTPTKCPCNTPIFPVQKANKQKWPLVHDIKSVNKVTEDFVAEVPNSHMLLSNIPTYAKYFSVIDLCSAFFSIPVENESRYLFAFSFKGQQYTYTRLPQSFKHSLNLFNQALKQDLAGLPLESTVLQYVDDILICAPTLNACHKDTLSVLTRLAQGGHKASLTKLQYCQQKGRILRENNSSWLKSHSTQPQTVG